MAVAIFIIVEGRAEFQWRFDSSVGVSEGASRATRENIPSPSERPPFASFEWLFRSKIPHIGTTSISNRSEDV